MKGKAILVDPVPNAATEQLKALLQDCLLVQAQQVRAVLSHAMKSDPMSHYCRGLQQWSINMIPWQAANSLQIWDHESQALRLNIWQECLV